MRKIDAAGALRDQPDPAAFFICEILGRECVALATSSSAFAYPRGHILGIHSRAGGNPARSLRQGKRLLKNSQRTIE